MREFAAGKSFADYQSDKMLRQAVERAFEILGEALVRLRRDDPATAGRIDHAGEIVGFRNALAHEYDRIDDSAVWRYLHEDLPLTRSRLEALLSEPDDPEEP